jgi:hypothetical protein
MNELLGLHGLLGATATSGPGELGHPIAGAGAGVGAGVCCLQTPDFACPCSITELGGRHMT